MGGRGLGGLRRGDVVGEWCLPFTVNKKGILAHEIHSNPNLPWGGGFQAPNGNSVEITMARDPTGPNWSSSMTMGSRKLKIRSQLHTRTSTRYDSLQEAANRKEWYSSNGT